MYSEKINKRLRILDFLHFLCVYEKKNQCKLKNILICRIAYIALFYYACHIIRTMYNFQKCHMFVREIHHKAINKIM